MQKTKRICIFIPGGPGIGNWIYSNHLPKHESFEFIFFNQRNGVTHEVWVEELTQLIEETSSHSEVTLIAHSSGGCLLSKALGNIKSNVHAAIFLSCPIDASVDLHFMDWLKQPDQNLLDEFGIKNRNKKLDLVGDPLPELWRAKSVLANQFFDNWKMFFAEKNKVVLKDFFAQSQFVDQLALSFYENDFPKYNLLTDLENINLSRDKMIYLYPENDQRITPNHIKPIRKHDKIDVRLVAGSHFCFLDEPEAFQQALLEIIQIS